MKTTLRITYFENDSRIILFANDRESKALFRHLTRGDELEILKSDVSYDKERVRYFLIQAKMHGWYVVVEKAYALNGIMKEKDIEMPDWLKEQLAEYFA